MSVINDLLSQSLNHILWVIFGLASWVGAYWQLYKVKPETFADVVTLVLSVLPLGVAIVSFVVTAARWNGKHHYEAWVFLVLGVVSGLYFLWLYASDTKVREILKKRKVIFTGRARVMDLPRGRIVTYSGLKTSTPLRIVQILGGAISVLASVTLLIWGGWELIHGSVFIGRILAPVGGGTLLLDRWPKERIKVFGHDWRISLDVFGHKWRGNLFEVTYSALMEGSASSQPDAVTAEPVAS
jgi:hypothetical protein